MKLSEKGLGKLYNSKACYYDDETEEEVVALSYFEHVFEFEPDDFTGMVSLTVEEAKELATKLKSNAEFFFLQTGEFDHDTDALWLYLTDKIEQTEGK